jgi:hypothetical protein
MPTYDGIGSSITHNVEVDGNLFLQDIEGGPDSTRVPLEIFSNLVSSSVESANSRMLRLRVQNYGETNTDNSYVTDMGIRGEANKDYFFITAPQNTSNVGDQNTFVISSTSNVGIGTTDPGHYRLLVNNSSTKHFGVPGNDTPTTGDTLVYNESGEWVYHFVEGTLPPGSVNNEILTWNGANWVPNSSIITTNSNTSIGIGTYTPSANLHVIGSVTATTDVDISGKFQGGKLRVGSLLSAVPTNPNVTVPGDLTVSGTLTSDAWIHTDDVTINGNIDVTGTITASNIVGGSPLTITSDQNLQVNSNLTVGTSNLFVNNLTGYVGIGVASPNYTLDVNGGVRTRLPWLYARNTTQGGYTTSYNVTFNLVEARDTTVGDMYNTSYACTFPVKGVYVVDIFSHSALGGQHTAWYQGYIRYSNGTAYHLVSGNTKQSPTTANWDTYTENTWVLYVPNSNMYLDLTFYTSLSTIKNYAGSWNRIRAACIYAVQ